jgi:transposase InsO family protein/antitoxin (DNA-binding transcriptional repressor) of toxin-antitoxin stability system
MMKTVNIHEAKTHLSRLIAAACAGEPFVIARAGRPLVRVEAIGEAARASRLDILKGEIAVPDSRATLHRHLAAANRPDAPRRRRGPQGAMSDTDLAGRIRALLAASPFHGEGYRKLWARLRHAGVRTSPRRVLRVMRDDGLLAHQRAGSPRGPRSHDGTIITARVDAMWGTDMTSVATGEGLAAVFIAIDHCSAECVGIHASAQATRHEALEPIRQGVRRSFGAVGADVAKGLKVRHDHGSQYVSRDFQRELCFLSAESSPAFVRAPEGNGCAERFIRSRRRTCSGSAGSRRSRNCAGRCSRSSRPTTSTGSSSATATAHPPPSDESKPRTCNAPHKPSPLSQNEPPRVPRRLIGLGYAARCCMSICS